MAEAGLNHRTCRRDIHSTGLIRRRNSIRQNPNKPLITRLQSEIKDHFAFSFNQNAKTAPIAPLDALGFGRQTVPRPMTQAAGESTVRAQRTGGARTEIGETDLIDLIDLMDLMDRARPHGTWTTPAAVPRCTFKMDRRAFVAWRKCLTPVARPPSALPRNLPPAVPNVRKVVKEKRNYVLFNHSLAPIMQTGAGGLLWAHTTGAGSKCRRHGNTRTPAVRSQNRNTACH